MISPEIFGVKGVRAASGESSAGLQPLKSGKT